MHGRINRSLSPVDAAASLGQDCDFFVTADRLGAPIRCR
jgi:hypothetical protein